MMHKPIPKTSFVVLNYNDAETTEALISKIIDYENVEHIIIVDNCSTDNSYEMLSAMARDKVELIRTPNNGGYGFGNNYGLRYAIEKYDAKYIAISNPDIYIEESALSRLLVVLEEHTEAGVVAPLMKDIHGSRNFKCAWKVPSFWQYLLFSMPLLSKLTDSMYYQEAYLAGELSEVGCVAGSLLIVRQEAIEAAGYYDENIFLYCEETCLGIKLSKTIYKTYIVGTEEFVHAHSVSINKSIKSGFKKANLLWVSRSYVLQNYYRSNVFRLLMIHLIRALSLLELYVYSMVRKKTRVE